MYAEFREYVTRIKLFSGSGVVGFTTPSAFGAIFIKVPPINQPMAYFLEHLVHEFGHLRLNVLMAHDRLLENDDSERYTSPIRPDPRPLFQVLHAVYVLSQVVRVFRRVVARGAPPEFAELLTEFEQQFEDGLKTILDHGRMTERGRVLVDSLRVCVDGA